jgi:hypothetical protein
MIFENQAVNILLNSNSHRKYWDDPEIPMISPLEVHTNGMALKADEGIFKT